MAADGASEGTVQGGTLLRLFAEEEQAANTQVRGESCQVVVCTWSERCRYSSRLERLREGRGRAQRQQGAGAGGLGGARNDDVDKFWKLGYGCDPSLEAPMVRVNE